MAQWQNKINIKKTWNGYEAGENTLQDICGEIVSELGRIRPNVEKRYPDELDDLDGIIAEFLTLRDDKSATVDEFDNVLESLYDWGDTALDSNFVGKKLCWIEKG